ncbi:cell division cycle-associated protein 7-like [Cololabis saira]|uniref:cell division cycle-associated protein 7-like n=1 Tax=Cololabis saira TaxID=129043 RepID=UPI002AD57F34|nr:cell division cycle-associated protein 7-like [Cololabis saira]
MCLQAQLVVGLHFLTRELADVFEEDSESDVTFYGFSDTEIGETNSDFEPDQSEPGISPKKQESTSQRSAGPQPFKLRVALRSAPSTRPSSDDDEYYDAEEEVTKSKKTKKKRHESFEDEETAVTTPEEHGCDSAGDVSNTFLAKREQNIKANKTMLAQLMADLQKMPGGAGLLEKQATKQKTKERRSRPPRSVENRNESRRNPERASRRRTRSMGVTEDGAAAQQEDVELSLEEELLEVRRAPRQRGPRSQNKSHVIRPVEDITEDEIQLVADNMTDKVYNSVTGSTCHQCRQKTVDTKTCCRSEDCRGIQGQFCGPCLRNRYGEDVRKALLDQGWKCPPCRGICNCSFCRAREGRCPTGILLPLAKYNGFSDVHSYLSSLRNKLKGEEKVEM